MCRSGAPGGTHLVTFGARVLYATVERGSAELVRTGARQVGAGPAKVRRSIVRAGGFVRCL